MSLIDQYARAHDGAFLHQIEAAIVAAAHNIYSEPGNTANHANRVTLAQKVLANPSGYAPRFALSVATTNANIMALAPGNQAADSDIQTSLGGVWDAQSPGV